MMSLHTSIHSYHKGAYKRMVLRGAVDAGNCLGVDVRMRPSVRRMILRMRKITQSAGRTRQGHAIQQTGIYPGLH